MSIENNSGQIRYGPSQKMESAPWSDTAFGVQWECPLPDMIGQLFGQAFLWDLVDKIKGGQVLHTETQSQA